MSNEIIKPESDSEEINTSIRSFVTAQNFVYSAVNYAMVTTYWEIGEQVFKACEENDRVEFGDWGNSDQHPKPEYEKTIKDPYLPACLSPCFPLKRVMIQ